VKSWGSLADRSLVRYGAWAVALFYIAWFLRWTIRPDHFFFADDWDWFRRAEFYTLRESWSFLPQYYLNDRPMGAVVIRALYRAFGLNPAPSNWMCLGLHLLNTSLLLAVARRMIRSWWVSAATALAYGTWSAALRGVSWLADIFDLLGLTLILLTFLCFTSRQRILGAASVVLYFLALRTKEAAIGVPLLLLVYILISQPRRESLRESAQRLWPHVLLALVFVGVYASLIADHRRVEDPLNPYHLVFTPATFFNGLFFYASRMMYGGPWPVGRLIRWTVVLSVLAAGVVWRARATILGLAGFLIFLGPVIFMAGQREPLYLYIPGAFFVLALGGAADAAAARLSWAPSRREAAAAAFMLLCAIALPHAAHQRANAAWVLENTTRARQDLQAFRANVPALRSGARVALIGFPEGYNLFRTPGCSVLKVLYHAEPVNCVFTEDAAGADVAVHWRKDGIDVHPLTAGAR
jgi:hypothetical protein